MTVCSGKLTHEEIVHEGWDCPLCKVLSEYDAKRSELKREIEDLREQLGQLSSFQGDPDPSEDRAQTS